MRKENRFSIILVFLLYEQALIQLLDNAKEAIVVSMYGISPGGSCKAAS